MKKKKISLFCAILSLVVAFAYIALALVLVMRAINAKEYVPTADSSLWIMSVLKRLKEAGFNIFFSIMGIVLSLVLALYRFTLTYFYLKIFKSDDTFYKARLGDIVLFSILSGFVIAVLSWLCWGWKGILPVEVQPFVLGLFLAYILLCPLPLIELLFVYLSKLIGKKPKEGVPTRKGIIQELDELADKTAREIAKQQEDKKEQPLPIIQPMPKVEVAVAPRVRKVVEYVTSFWDVEDDAISQEIKNSAYTKSGVRKKNRKPSYNGAMLRVKKSMNRKTRLKLMPPTKVRLRYHKVNQLNRVGESKRK